MRLYNTMSRQVEPFAPREAGHVGLYACGFTVYDFTHLGHLRKYALDDVLVRVLRHEGLEVKHVQNVTDVGHLSSDADTGEDKLEKGAKKYGKSVWDIAHEFEEYFWYSMDLMGNLRPDISCRATDHIEEQLEMVKQLEAKGFAYVIEGDGVYFDTSKVSDYGKLAGLDLEMLQEGARLEPVPGKRNPTDFALWKFEREGENRAMVWPSPWAERSFPGWHIECSAMAIKYLGEQFDVHTGGIDHIPVHHTNEIAQAEAASGKQPFVKYWVHHNFLRVDNEKMSKSLGNFFTIDDVLKKGYAPQALRLLFLTTHYRSEMNFTWESLAATHKSWRKLQEHVAAWSDLSLPKKELSAPAQGYYDRFFAAMADDLRTPEAVAELWTMIKDGTMSAAEKYKVLLKFDEVLGLGLTAVAAADVASSHKQVVEQSSLPEAVTRLLAERLQARTDRNWEESDRLRLQLNRQGFEVVDEGREQKVYRQGASSVASK